jgi:hypothetical protein
MVPEPDREKSRSAKKAAKTRTWKVKKKARKRA